MIKYVLIPLLVLYGCTNISQETMFETAIDVTCSVAQSDLPESFINEDDQTIELGLFLIRSACYTRNGISTSQLEDQKISQSCLQLSDQYNSQTEDNNFTKAYELKCQQ